MYLNKYALCGGSEILMKKAKQRMKNINKKVIYVKTLKHFFRDDFTVFKLTIMFINKHTSYFKFNENVSFFKKILVCPFIKIPPFVTFIFL